MADPTATVTPDPSAPVAVVPKNPLLSKTNWLGLLYAIVSFFPVVRDWVAANPQIVLIVTGALFAILRSVTGVPLELRRPVRYQSRRPYGQR